MSTATSNYFLRMAETWQNYFDATKLFPGIILSPEQLSIIQQNEEHLLITGSAGSGKSVVLLSKMIQFMEHQDERQRVLYVTFNQTLREDANKRMAQAQYPRFSQVNEKHQIGMHTFHYMAWSLLRKLGFTNVQKFDTSVANIQKVESELRRKILSIWDNVQADPEFIRLPNLYKTHTPQFLLDEFLWMKANGYTQKEVYLDSGTERTGRGASSPLSMKQRETVFFLFEKYNTFLKEKMHNYFDPEDYALELLGRLSQLSDEEKYDAIFVDEVQDLQPMQLKVLAGLAKKMLVLTGDPKQRIYKRTYAALDIHIQGKRKKTLRKNFRSTRQIMSFAASLTIDDAEKEQDSKDIYQREGEPPEIYCYPSKQKYVDALAEKIENIFRENKGEPVRIAVVHHSEELLQSIERIPLQGALAKRFSLISVEKYHQMELQSTRRVIFFTDVYSVKGLEFDYVFVVDFDNKHYPLKSRVDKLEESKGDKEDFAEGMKEIDQEQKRLLYVALTRAKKMLYLMWYSKEPEQSYSPYLLDFSPADYKAVGFAKTKIGKS